MTDKRRAEIHLEINTGFFRLKTEEVIYNITVLGSEESSAVRVVEKIVEKERESPPQTDFFQPPPPLPEDKDDDFYKEISTSMYKDIGSLAKSLSSTIMTIPAEDRKLQRVQLDEAGDKLQDAKTRLIDIVQMTEKATMNIMDSVEKIQKETIQARDLLSYLKVHKAFEEGEETSLPNEAVETHDLNLGEELERLKDLATQSASIIKDILSGAETSADEEGSDQKGTKKSQYSFSLDVIFQTLYEFCTNEAVKKHIQTARQKGEEIFDLKILSTALNKAVEDIPPDADNFFNIPLTDLFSSLVQACNAESFQKLITKMDQNKDAIFLDKSLPLEVPPQTQPLPEEKPKGGEHIQKNQDNTRISDLKGLTENMLSSLNDILLKTADQQRMIQKDADDLYSRVSKRDQAEVFTMIESAFGIVSAISNDLSNILESLSFQDLSGQQIMKIIKLLSDFEIQLLALVVAFGSRLKHKETHQDITLEESKVLAQQDVDNLMSSLRVEDAEEQGTLDQTSVNRLLGQLGF